MEIVFFFYIFVIVQVLFESFYIMQALNLNVLHSCHCRIMLCRWFYSLFYSLKNEESYRKYEIEYFEKYLCVRCNTPKNNLKYDNLNLTWEKLIYDRRYFIWVSKFISSSHLCECTLHWIIRVGNRECSNTFITDIKYFLEC